MLFDLLSLRQVAVTSTIFKVALTSETMCRPISFSNDGPLVFLMTLWVSGNLSQRRSLDPTEGIEGNTIESLFCVPAHGYAAVVGRRETLRAGSRITTIQLTRHTIEKHHPIVGKVDRCGRLFSPERKWSVYILYRCKLICS